MSCWFLVIFFLATSLISLNDLYVSEARHVRNLPYALVVGTVYCDTCFQDDFSKASHFISGATVAVECRDGHSPTKTSFQKQVKTDSHGKFKVNLPFPVSKHVNKIKGCSVKLVRSSEPYCAVASTASSSSLHLKSRKQGTHIFSAGFFTFKPLKQPSLCNQKPLSLVDSQKSLPSDFPPPLQDPATPPDLSNILPPLPLLPPLELPLLPPLPPLGDEKPAQPQQLFPPLLPQPPPLIPNPLQPPPLFPNPFQPPAPLIPNPFQAPRAPIIPNPFQAPPAPIFPFLPIPGFTPSPPLPPRSLFPPLPLPPLPRIPGLPPASPLNSSL